ncbi:2-dehydropantoate 2-reductase [Clavibacter lycopersici]|uniref:2-dehydropantoate 2-reductase n=1 Tax=Clavibacter lycopersici TaxID=2301718 RepID=A0A399TA33_9MICO|nr:2-dehydropantoate 2-reductase [Clavibacter lycopersici]RIJ52418.1 2-dehydropantoate 2-reductase [Clavibacter lycopersici]RIJ60719.1 2-dehydropantoate 2-reductase [Clavibacter lycopersici]
MRIGVLGAGAVGGTIAALLERAGHEVDVTARGTHLRAIQDSGLHLVGGYGDHVARVAAAERLGRPPELAIVATKIADARDAMTENAGWLRGIPVLVVQNGLSALTMGVECLPRSQVVGGLALVAASLTQPGLITVTSAAGLQIGTADGPDGAGVALVREALDPVMPVTVAADFRGAQWTKLVINGINAVPAITGLSVQAVIAEPVLRRIVARTMQETVRTGLATGVTFGTLGGLTHRRLRLFASVPLPLAERLPVSLARNMGQVPNPGSTLQSIRRSRPTEVDHLNGAISAIAPAAGVDARVNAALVQLVHAVEASGRHISPAELARLVPR